jgi:hypothetical protein
MAETLEVIAQRIPTEDDEEIDAVLPSLHLQDDEPSPEPKPVPAESPQRFSLLGVGATANLNYGDLVRDMRILQKPPRAAVVCAVAF